MNDEIIQDVSLHWVKARCTNDGGCWLWDKACNASGQPSYSFRRRDGRRPTRQMRRVVWELVNGPIPPAMLVAVSCNCKTCLNPAHLELTTRSEVVRGVWTRADARAKKTRTLTARSRERAKLDMDKARYIRESTKTLQVLAEELAVSMALVSKVRRGVAWREDVNPFAGLFAGLAGKASWESAR